MNEVLKLFIDNNDKLINKTINVYGWKFNYTHILTSSISNYLFEKLNITDNIAPSSNENRDGRIKEKKYICVHDTGDTDDTHTAFFWSDVVNKEYWEQGKYKASFQYVTGNDGIYHQIPDNEVAYHAGDGTQFEYKLYDSGIDGNNINPNITISDDEYYTIDGNKTSIKAPGKYDINSQGILVKIINGRYYIGETYYNATYNLIANHGGNCNSIGIESCINEGSDIYLTWQRTAKLVAKLMYDNKLSIVDVKQHHYFSGKNCPQTMRMNNMWNHFINLVKFEYQMLLYQLDGYEILLKCNDYRVNSNGRVLLDNNKNNIKYRIVTKYKGIIDYIDLEKEIG